MTARPLREVLERVDLSVPVDPSATYPMMGVRSFGRGAFAAADLRGADTRYPMLRRVERDLLVYPKLMAWEGAFAVVPGALHGRFVSPEFVAFRPGSKVYPAYLAHLVAWEGFREGLGGLSAGTNARRRRLQPDQLLDFRVPLPDIAEQRRIAAHLNAVEKSVRSLDDNVTSSAALISMSLLPRVVARTIACENLRQVQVEDLADAINDTVHPGDNLCGASDFVGLEHVESHTGRRIGSRPVGDESGRKFRFEKTDITYGYLRPYLNKAWVADRIGLCSVEQFVLRPRLGVDPILLAHLLRSSIVLESAVAATNNLQLPRLKLGTLLGFQVPDIRLATSHLLPRLEQLASQFVRLDDVRGRRMELASGVLPAARNEIFNAMR